MADQGTNRADTSQPQNNTQYADGLGLWLIAVSVMLPTFMEVLDTSIASVALPHIAGSLSASTDEATWVLTSYLVANAVILPASTWFSLKFGRRNFLLTCIVIFTVASFLCGAATSLGWILIARAIQGAGGGALQPISQAILLESFPPAKRGMAMAAFGLGVVVAPVLGPTLGGWLTDTYSWRWAFYINIPVGIAAVLMVSRFIKDPKYIRCAKPGRLDGIGLGLLAIWLACLQMILDKGQEDDWLAATWLRWALGVAVVTLVLFIVRQLTARKPLVNLKVYCNRNFAIGSLLIALFGAVIYGLITILPLFYQTLMNYTASASGLAVSPRGIGALFTMPIVGLLSGRVDNRLVIGAGFVITGLAGWWMSGLTLQISQWSLVWPIIFTGVGAGMVFVPLSTLAMGTLPNDQIGNASGLYNLLRNIGGSVGISLCDTLIARHQQTHQSELVRHLAPGPLFHAAFQRIQALMTLHVPLRTATQRGYAEIQLLLMQQSVTYSYVDVLRYLAFGCFLCAPIVFLVRRVKAQSGRAMAH